MSRFFPKSHGQPGKPRGKSPPTLWSRSTPTFLQLRRNQNQELQEQPNGSFSSPFVDDDDWSNIIPPMLQRTSADLKVTSAGTDDRANKRNKRKTNGAKHEGEHPTPTAVMKEWPSDAETSGQKPRPRLVHKQSKPTASVPSAESSYSSLVSAPKPPAGIWAKIAAAGVEKVSSLSPLSNNTNNTTISIVSLDKKYADIANCHVSTPLERSSASPGSSLMQMAGELHDVQSFTSSRKVLGTIRRVDPKLRARLEETGLDVASVNYKGDLSVWHLIQRGTPEGNNCSVFVTYISEDASLQQIFNAIAGAKPGRVFSYSKMEQVKGKYRYCSASIVFFSRITAWIFKAKADSDEGITLNGLKLKVIWNQHIVGPVEAYERHQTRVLQIHCHPDDFRGDAPDKLLRPIHFDLVGRSEVVDKLAESKTITLEFPSVRRNSRMVDKYLNSLRGGKIRFFFRGMSSLIFYWFSLQAVLKHSKNCTNLSIS